MAFRLLRYLIMGCGLILIVIRCDVILAHRMIFKTVPHEDAAQIGMTVENNPIQIINLALLEFRTAPDRGKGLQMVLVGPILCPQAQDYGPVLQLH